MFEKKYIYKITNIVNGKVYIGQSNNPKKRFENHMSRNKVENVKFQDDIIKFGRDNFKLEILGLYENYNEMEQFYIKKYNSIDCGYNSILKAETPPVMRGEEHPLAKLSMEDVEKIRELLKNTRMSFFDIAKMFNCEQTNVKRINFGEIWHDKNINYPIRKISIKEEQKEISNKIKKMIFAGDKTLKQIAKELNVSYSRVKAINNGQNYKEDMYKYPLQSNRDYNKAVSTISDGE